MKQRGFTILEVAIVLVIISILLVIGTVTFRGLQTKARDQERQADVQAIANYLESIYPKEIRSANNADIIKPAGSYPARHWFYTSSDEQRQGYKILFADLDRSAVYGPGDDKLLALTPSGNHYSETGITQDDIKPRDRLDSAKHYIYLPLRKAGGEPCVNPAHECRAFQLYYRLESGEYKMVESKYK